MDKWEIGILFWLEKDCIALVIDAAIEWKMKSKCISIQFWRRMSQSSISKLSSSIFSINRLWVSLIRSEVLAQAKLDRSGDSIYINYHKFRTQHAVIRYISNKDLGQKYFETILLFSTIFGNFISKPYCKFWNK